MAELRSAIDTVGMLLAAAAAVAAILFSSGANNTVDDVVERITGPVERLDERVAEATAAIDSADGSELDARLTGIVDQTSSARAGIETVTEHPLYAALPIDADPFEDTVDSIEDSGALLLSSAAVDLTASGRGEVADELDKISTALVAVDDNVDDLADSLRFWIRLSGLGFLALSLWGFVAQLSLYFGGAARFAPLTNKGTTKNEHQRGTANRSWRCVPCGGVGPARRTGRTR